jgi:hypothetical protein
MTLSVCDKAHDCFPVYIDAANARAARQIAPLRDNARNQRKSTDVAGNFLMDDSQMVEMTRASNPILGS